MRRVKITSDWELQCGAHKLKRWHMGIQTKFHKQYQAHQSQPSEDADWAACVGVFGLLDQILTWPIWLPVENIKGSLAAVFQETQVKSPPPPHLPHTSTIWCNSTADTRSQIYKSPTWYKISNAYEYFLLLLNTFTGGQNQFIISAAKIAWSRKVNGNLVCECMTEHQLGGLVFDFNLP